MTEWIIDRLGHRGDGIAHGPVYVSRTLPGEVVTGDCVDGKVDAPRIVTASPRRVAAPCRHYKGCGGCAVQHADDAFVAEWKSGIVRNALQAKGIEAAFRPIRTSPPQSRRRAVYSGRRTKKDVLVGFHAKASDTIVEVPDCELLLPTLRSVRPALADLLRAGASRKGELSFTVTDTAEGIDVAVSGGKPLDMALRVALATIVEEHELARLCWEDEVVALRASPWVDFDGITVVPPPGAFLQATRDGETALREAVFEATQDASQIADLFAGCGTFALPLARGAEVHAVEGAAALTDALEVGWRNATGLKQVTTETRDLFRRPLYPDELKRFDAVVIDPPRAGAEAQIRQIAASPVTRVAAVSCNPVSFARDAAILVESGFRVDWVQVVDQFRWSTHVELAASLSRGHIAA